MTTSSLRYRTLIQLAIPVILANIAVPLLGLVDTAVIGHTGDAAALGAIALGALVFSFVYWGFGFLRMGTTGFIARATGARDNDEVRAALTRALLLGLGIGLLLIVLQGLISQLALLLLGGSDDARALLREYIHLRIWGAPATLATFALLGTLIGLGRTRHLLVLQVFLNGLNILLDVYFVLVLDWGVAGVALGTVIAEWSALLLGLWLLWPLVRPAPGQPWPWPLLRQRQRWQATLRTNSHIMWRTLFLLAGFGWFARQGAALGDDVLAANHVLLQFIAFSAFFLDGYAFVVESQVGQAVGARDRQRFRDVIVRSSHLAVGTALLLALLVLLLGHWGVHALTSIDSVREVAIAQLPWVALYVALSCAAFQLDGIFIGTSESRPMRNSTLVALLLFIGASAGLATWGNTGLWLAFVLFVVFRGLTLGACLPGLYRRHFHQDAAD
ncbi:MATE family efflux transporter [Alcanivorax sp. JB21]|uniref:MATE family efflux transporter n=1 Tax=Alcanivorax limicola TaxID=2874102 RepID=UPI001CBDCD25|nr:MATE family efflux transporter [Alcanivorax limicola]MBZ2189718.1 MATE family efflux transporter [Alcanivorax limicola]